jgi:hypothetical protein
MRRIIENRPSTQQTTSLREEIFLWTDALQQSFREELEKLVILDYIMRNTTGVWIIG